MPIALGITAKGDKVNTSFEHDEVTFEEASSILLSLKKLEQEIIDWDFTVKFKVETDKEENEDTIEEMKEKFTKELLEGLKDCEITYSRNIEVVLFKHHGEDVTVNATRGTKGYDKRKVIKLIKQLKKIK